MFVEIFQRCSELNSRKLYGKQRKTTESTEITAETTNNYALFFFGSFLLIERIRAVSERFSRDSDKKY